LKKRIKITITPKITRYQLDKQIGEEYRNSSENISYTEYKRKWLKSQKSKG